MELGYSVMSAQPSERPTDRAVTALLERAETAARSGVEFVQVGDHHVMADRQYIQNVPLAGRLTDTFDSVGALFLLPLYDPLLVAEYTATLSGFVDSFELWCAIGWREAEFDAFGVPIRERVPRFEESLEILHRLWSEDSVTYAGDYYELTDVSMNPKASPHVVIGGRAEPAVRRAGRRGDAWVAHPEESLERLEEKIRWAKNEGDVDVFLRRDALVMEDGAEARVRADRLLEAGYRGWPEDTTWPIIGDVDAAAAQLERYEELGVDRVVVRPMEEDSACDTLRGVAAARDRL